MSGISPEVRRYIQLWKPHDRTTWPEWYRWDGGWYEVDGDRTRYCEWPLTAQSVVFDVGAYEGAWAQRIAKRYDPTLHLFEPAPRALKVAQGHLGSNPKVHLHPFGLGTQDATLLLGDCERDGASFCKPIQPSVMAQIRRADEVIDELGVEHIDLMSLNIEGGEYELLPHMMDVGLVGKIERMMVQWHWLDESSAAQQMEIQARMARTHRMLWNHGAWEAWGVRA